LGTAGRHTAVAAASHRLDAEVKLMVARLLHGVRSAPVTLADHMHLHGPLPAPRPSVISAEIERSGLRGRGGGAFPLARKLAAVKRGRGRPTVIVNGCEGEPLSVKDGLLLGRLPHLVIDGALCLASAVGAREILVAIDEVEIRTGETIHRALEQRPELRDGRITAQVVWTPTGYLGGQETAIVAWYEQGVAKPRFGSPRVTERGIDGRPTLMANAETAAHVALVTRHGGEWFRQAGTDADPGTALVTVCGAVTAPAVYEIEHGLALSELLALAGGCSEPPRAFLLGGYAGAWVDSADAAAIRLSPRELAPLRARLGAGIVYVLPDRACPVAETTRVAGWLADQSSGQCGPCVNGLAAVANELERVCAGDAGRRALAEIRRWCELTAGRGACAHPDGAASFVTSALRVFADEFSDHARHGPCDACRWAAMLPTSERAVAIA
jgi:NADH:ubiquinone oxidoreductase subunit F (NADH-binding)